MYPTVGQSTPPVWCRVGQLRQILFDSIPTTLIPHTPEIRSPFMGIMSEADQNNSSDRTHEGTISLRGGSPTDHVSHDYECTAVGSWMTLITDGMEIVVCYSINHQDLYTSNSDSMKKKHLNRSLPLHCWKALGHCCNER